VRTLSGAMNLTTVLFLTMSVDAPGKNYTSLLECWLKQMRFHKVPNVAVMMGHRNPDHVELCHQHNVAIIPVKPYLTRSPADSSYLWQGTKINMMNLTRWKTVVYFDMDFLFYDSPALCVSLCRSSFCATRDSGVPGTYFNAGMMIIKPSKQMFLRAKNAMDGYSPKRFAEQDLLNEIFDAQLLPRICNVVSPTADDFKSARGLLHEKLWSSPPDARPSVCSRLP